MKKIVKIMAAVLVISFIYFGYRELSKDKDTSTEANCFGFDSGMIVSYNEICGSDITIPEQINEETVLKIGNYAFKDKELESVIIPETVTEIGIGAFQNNLLRDITIPDSVVEIKALAFENNLIRDLSIGQNVSEIGVKAFAMNDLKTKYAFIYKRVDGKIDNTVLIGYGGRSKEITIPASVSVIEHMALSGNELESITLNKNLTRIESYALSNNLIEEIIIPTGVMYIGDGNLTDETITSINILGKKDLSEFNYFDKEFSRDSILEFGE